MDKDTRMYNGIYVGFLFRLLKIPYHKLDYWVFDIPEFLDIITENIRGNVPITERMVFETMQKIYREKFYEKGFYPSRARPAIDFLSYHINGNSKTWNGRELQKINYLDTPDFDDMSELKTVLSDLSPAQQRAVFKSEKLLEIIRKHGFSNIEDVYAGFREFFYPMRPSKDGRDYYKFREVAREFSRVMHGDRDWWTRDFEEHKSR